jgi:hypothetical protein
MNFRIRNLVAAQQTNNNISIFEEVTAPGFGPPLHSHLAQLEIFHIIRGRHKFRLGARKLKPGRVTVSLSPPACPTPLRISTVRTGSSILSYCHQARRRRSLTGW